MLVRRLVRIYTPFMCAIIMLIQEALIKYKYEGLLSNYLSEYSGHSVLVIAYILCTCDKMCKWYKITNWLLFSTHILNILYLSHIINIIYDLAYAIIAINIAALITFLIYRLSVGITTLRL